MTSTFSNLPNPATLDLPSFTILDVGPSNAAATTSSAALHKQFFFYRLVRHLQEVGAHSDVHPHGGILVLVLRLSAVVVSSVVDPEWGSTKEG
jgi:hypothetical protein